MPSEEPAEKDRPPVRTEPLPDQPAEGTRLERRSVGVPPARMWIIVGAAVVVIGLAIGLFVALSGGGKTTPPAPKRAGFTFSLGRVTAVTVGSSKPKEKAVVVAGSIQNTLSSFYDQAFLDPASWKGSPPAGMWAAFAPAAQARARADAQALTLSGIGKVTLVKATGSSLDVRVLYDPQAKPTIATGNVRFEADGTLARGGKHVHILSTSQLFLRDVSGKWLIVGYASASTQIVQPGAASSGSPTP